MADTASSSASDDPTSGSSKKSKIADTVNGDVISTLPDEVLCYLLSFIPTKHAVSTSVLSKRWKLLWTSIPNLDFSFNADYPVNQINFMNFVDRVLSMNNVLNVQKVYLVCSDDCDSSRVKAWTSAIAGRDTKHFNLRIPISCCIEKLDQISQIVSLPDRFFIHQNLILLELENVALKAPTSVDFPSLKTMFLTSVQFLDEASVKILLAGCPVLETLFLTRCGRWDNAKALYICSPTLSSLNLQNEHCNNKKSGYKVRIEAPKLTKLNLTDYVNLDCDMNNISSLAEAYVDFELDDRVAMDGEGEAYNERVFEFFRKISQIQELNIGCIAMHALESANMEYMPKFNNLTSLTVLLNLKSSPILLDLFNCSPNLVSFVLEMDNVHPDCEWYEPDHVPQCLLSSLEKIEITEFEECDAEMEMVFYFLSNAMVLKKMKIVSFHLDIETEVDILKQLVNFPRSSSTCEVDYTNYCFKENENGSFEEAEEI